MSTTDELEGVILAYTVAEAAHIKLLEGVYGSEGHGPHVRVTKEYWSDGVMIRNSRMVPYRPDRDFVQAWELVEECNFTVAPKMPIGAQFNACKGRTGWAVYDCGSNPLAFANLPSTSALCTAICRAYLKVVGTE